MKARTKITALAVFAAFAVIAALAVFSCAPEVELTDVSWKEINSEYNSGKNSVYTAIVSGFSATSVLATGAGEANEVTITFPARSDFLKNTSDSKIASGLKQFLSFHHFTKPEIPEVGKADTLGDALTYTFVRRNANVVTVKLDKTFAVTDSRVIMKINGTKYTFAGGVKLDLVGTGKSGQAGYDDLYFELPVSTVTGPSGFTGTVWSGGIGNRGLGFNQGWYLQLLTISKAPSDTIEPTEYFIARLVTGLTGNSEEVSTKTKTIAEGLKGGLKVQEFTNGSWRNATATVNFLVDEATPSAVIFYVNPITLKDLVPIRVMWEGKNTPVATADNYFGVKQYIAIRGVNTSTTTNTYRTYQSAKVYGSAGIWYDLAEGRSFYAGDYVSDVFVSKDNNKQNVVFEVVFDPVISGDPETTYWIKDFTNNKQKFKDNFKVAYYSGGGGNYTAFTSRTDVVFIPIKNVEFFIHNPDNDPLITGLNAVRITLDPVYENTHDLYFYISSEIGYTDGKTTFGNPANFTNGFFEVYEATWPMVQRPLSYPLLSANVWANSNLPSASSIDYFYFPVKKGTTYYLWSNDGYEGDGTKTAAMYIDGRYSNSSTWLFEALWGWDEPVSFIAEQHGYLIIEVWPDPGFPLFGIPPGTGTYAVAYNTTGTRP